MGKNGWSKDNGKVGVFMTPLESKLDDLLNVWTNSLISQLVDPPPELVVALVKALKECQAQRDSYARNYYEEHQDFQQFKFDIDKDDQELLAILEAE